TSVSDLLKNTQLEFWAVNMGESPAYDPMAETEYLVQADLRAADLDDSLRYVASTYDARSQRVVLGTGIDGPRVLNFAPLLDLEEYPLNKIVTRLLSACENAVGVDVEIEFAVNFASGRDNVARFGFLQVRPMVVPEEMVEITDEEMVSKNVLLASERVMGNGIEDRICDVVFVKPESFEARFTGTIADQLERLNLTLISEERPYLLIGFGRWGSVDPWLGVPVDWGQICGARAIVEATLPNMNVEPSQGSHFFHNISSFQVSYFSVHHDRQPNIDWNWLKAQEMVAESEHVRQVRSKAPLRIKVDGRTGRGGVWYQ
ncbi:MAG: hypothetical protein OEQ39_28800, partial [Gammaproteobacteria bacterium]|nr:hypothetical protein [Gammaproteobacteria bacterium]